MREYEYCTDCGCKLKLDEYYICENCQIEQLTWDQSEPLGNEEDAERGGES